MKKTLKYIIPILGILFVMVLFFGIINALFYVNKHGFYTKLFMSDSVITKEMEEKTKQIKSELVNESAIELSYSWRYLDDYNEFVQVEAIDKIKEFKHLDIVKYKFIVIGNSSYQHNLVRSRALCSIQDEIVYSSVLYKNLNTHHNDKWDDKFIFEHCLTEKNIKLHPAIGSGIIDIYEQFDGKYYVDLVKVSLRYNERRRNKYIEYLTDISSINRIFEDGLIDYLTDEDLLRKIKSFSDRKLILGDLNVKKALVEMLKIRNEKIISLAGEALNKAFHSDIEVQNILLSHLKEGNRKIKGVALKKLESFNIIYESSIVSSVSTFLEDKEYWNRKLAIKILKPLFKNKMFIANRKESKNIYNKILYISQHDLDEDVRKEALSAIK